MTMPASFTLLENPIHSPEPNKMSSSKNPFRSEGSTGAHQYHHSENGFAQQNLPLQYASEIIQAEMDNQQYLHAQQQHLAHQQKIQSEQERMRELRELGRIEVHRAKLRSEAVRDTGGPGSISSNPYEEILPNGSVRNGSNSTNYSNPNPIQVAADAVAGGGNTNNRPKNVSDHYSHRNSMSGRTSNHETQNASSNQGVQNPMRVSACNNKPIGTSGWSPRWDKAISSPRSDHFRSDPRGQWERRRARTRPQSARREDTANSSSNRPQSAKQPASMMWDSEGHRMTLKYDGRGNCSLDRGSSPTGIGKMQRENLQHGINSSGRQEADYSKTQSPREGPNLSSSMVVSDSIGDTPGGKLFKRGGSNSVSSTSGVSNRSNPREAFEGLHAQAVHSSGGVHVAPAVSSRSESHGTVSDSTRYSSTNGPAAHKSSNPDPSIVVQQLCDEVLTEVQAAVSDFETDFGVYDFKTYLKQEKQRQTVMKQREETLREEAEKLRAEKGQTWEERAAAREEKGRSAADNGNANKAEERGVSEHNGNTFTAVPEPSENANPKPTLNSNSPNTKTEIKSLQSRTQAVTKALEMLKTDQSGFWDDSQLDKFGEDENQIQSEMDLVNNANPENDKNPEPQCEQTAKNADVVIDPVEPVADSVLVADAAESETGLVDGLVEGILRDVTFTSETDANHNHNEASVTSKTGANASRERLHESTAKSESNGNTNLKESASGPTRGERMVVESEPRELDRNTPGPTNSNSQMSPEAAQLEMIIDAGLRKLEASSEKKEKEKKEKQNETQYVRARGESKECQEWWDEKGRGGRESQNPKNSNLRESADSPFECLNQKTNRERALTENLNKNGSPFLERIPARNPVTEEALRKQDLVLEAVADAIVGRQVGREMGGNQISRSQSLKCVSSPGLKPGFSEERQSTTNGKWNGTATTTANQNHNNSMHSSPYLERTSSVRTQSSPFQPLRKNVKNMGSPFRDEILSLAQTPKRGGVNDSVVTVATDNQIFSRANSARTQMNASQLTLTPAMTPLASAKNPGTQNQKSNPASTRIESRPQNRLSRMVDDLLGNKCNRTYTDIVSEIKKQAEISEGGVRRIPSARGTVAGKPGTPSSARIQREQTPKRVGAADFLAEEGGRGLGMEAQEVEPCGNIDDNHIEVSVANNNGIVNESHRIPRYAPQTSNEAETNDNQGKRASSIPPSEISLNQGVSSGVQQDVGGNTASPRRYLREQISRKSKEAPFVDDNTNSTSANTHSNRLSEGTHANSGCSSGTRGNQIRSTIHSTIHSTNVTRSEFPSEFPAEHGRSDKFNSSQNNDHVKNTTANIASLEAAAAARAAQRPRSAPSGKYVSNPARRNRVAVGRNGDQNSQGEAVHRPNSNNDINVNDHGNFETNECGDVNSNRPNTARPASTAVWRSPRKCGQLEIPKFPGLPSPIEIPPVVNYEYSRIKPDSGRTRIFRSNPVII